MLFPFTRVLVCALKVKHQGTFVLEKLIYLYSCLSFEKLIHVWSSAARALLESWIKMSRNFAKILVIGGP